MDAKGKATSDLPCVSHIFHMKVIAFPGGLLDRSFRIFQALETFKSGI